MNILSNTPNSIHDLWELMAFRKFLMAQHCTKSNLNWSKVDIITFKYVHQNYIILEENSYQSSDCMNFIVQLLFNDEL